VKTSHYDIVVGTDSLHEHFEYYLTLTQDEIRQHLVNLVWLA